MATVTVVVGTRVQEYGYVGEYGTLISLAYDTSFTLKAYTMRHNIIHVVYM